MITFIINSVLLGVGLAMDAFSVSLANGLNEPRMKAGRMLTIAGVFAIYQGVMPMTGWLCVHTIAQKFQAFEKLIPWIALILLSYIGGKMLKEGIDELRKKKGPSESCKVEEARTTALTDEEAHTTAAEKLGFGALMIQGLATSIDALSVGFTIADYGLGMATLCVLIIAILTLGICLAGLALGKRLGTILAGKASILGGVILIGIGLEIFISAQIG